MARKPFIAYPGMKPSQLPSPEPKEQVIGGVDVTIPNAFDVLKTAIVERVSDVADRVSIPFIQ